jgi:hypothetical protein
MAPAVTPQTVERIYGGHTNFQPTVQVSERDSLPPPATPACLFACLPLLCARAPPRSTHHAPL